MTFAKGCKFVTFHGKTYTNDFPFSNGIPFTSCLEAVCQKNCIRSNNLGHPFKNICIRSNGFIACLVKTLFRSNDLITRSVKTLISWMTWPPVWKKTPIHSNDLVTRSVKTLIRSNNLVTRLVKTVICSNDLAAIFILPAPSISEKALTNQWILWIIICKSNCNKCLDALKDNKHLLVNAFQMTQLFLARRVTSENGAARKHW